MSIIDWFAKKDKSISSNKNEKLNIPGDLWVKCGSCKDVLFLKELDSNLKVCPKCDYHFRLSAEERIAVLTDAKSFCEMDESVRPKDFLKFSDTQSYTVRIKEAYKKTKRHDAVITGQATVDGHPINIGVMDFGYMGGSMGSVVGEKITRVIEAGIKNHHPVVLVTSSGGARMQEGVMSLMQMAKTSAALALLAEEQVPYISILCDPTTGGTSASFAMLGDIHFAEPGALISFAGPRVIEQTIRQKLPKGFQRSEFLEKHGMVDRVVHRHDLKRTLALSLALLDPHLVQKKAPLKKSPSTRKVSQAKKKK